MYITSPDILDVIVDGLWSMTELGITAILILLGVKILNEKQEPTKSLSFPTFFYIPEDAKLCFTSGSGLILTNKHKSFLHEKYVHIFITISYLMGA
jgi:hypothetical protein